MTYKRFRLLLAFGFLGFLLYYVGTGDLLDVFRQIELRYIAYLVLLSVVLIWISCVKWQLFVRASGHEVPVIRLMRYYTTAYFFNLFMPSIIGGDIARSVQLGHQLRSYKTVFAATFIERFTGFFAMSLIGALFVAAGVQITTGVQIAILTVAGGTLLAGVVLFSKTLTELCFRIIVWLLKLFQLKALAARVEVFFAKVVEAVAFARNNYSLLGKALLLSFAFHFLAVANTYIVALAIGWNGAQFGGLCVVVPLVLLVSVAPVTPSALGIQEGAFLYFLTRLGATQAQGLGVGLVLRAKNIVTALVGGLIWLLSKDRPSLQKESTIDVAES